MIYKISEHTKILVINRGGYYEVYECARKKNVSRDKVVKHETNKRRIHSWIRETYNGGKNIKKSQITRR